MSADAIRTAVDVFAELIHDCEMLAHEQRVSTAMRNRLIKRARECRYQLETESMQADAAYEGITQLYWLAERVYRRLEVSASSPFLRDKIEQARQYVFETTGEFKPESGGDDGMDIDL